MQYLFFILEERYPGMSQTTRSPKSHQCIRSLSLSRVCLLALDCVSYQEIQSTCLFLPIINIEGQCAALWNVWTVKFSLDNIIKRTSVLTALRQDWIYIAVHLSWIWTASVPPSWRGIEKNEIIRSTAIYHVRCCVDHVLVRITFPAQRLQLGHFSVRFVVVYYHPLWPSCLLQGPDKIPHHYKL